MERKPMAPQSRRSKTKRTLPVSERQKISPAALARAWGLDPQKILRFIRDGSLRAINISLGHERARFLIDRRDIEEFERARAAISGSMAHASHWRRHIGRDSATSD